MSLKSLHDLFGQFVPLFDQTDLKDITFFFFFFSLHFNIIFVFPILVLEELLCEKCFEHLITLAAAGRASPAGQGGHPAPLLSPLRHIWSAVPSCELLRTVEVLQKMQRRLIKRIKGLEHLSCELGREMSAWV